MLSAAPHRQTRVEREGMDPGASPLRTPDVVRLDGRRRSANHEPRNCVLPSGAGMSAVLAELLPAPAEALWGAAADDEAGPQPPEAVVIDAAPPRAAAV